MQTSTMPFKQMENIGAFQAGAKAYGCSDVEVFQTAVRSLFSAHIFSFSLAQVHISMPPLEMHTGRI